MTEDGGVTCEDAGSRAPGRRNLTGTAELDVAFARVLAEAGVETRVRWSGAGRATAVRVESPALAARHVPLVRRMELATPGPDLAALLATVDVATVDDFTLVEVTAAWARQEAWAQAGQNAAVSELVARGRAGTAPADAALLVGARLGVTRYQADRRVGLAVSATELPRLRDAWAAGVVDRDKADALATTATLPADVRRAVVGGLLTPDETGISRAERCTAPQLRTLMRRAEQETDPGGAADRHERARAERYVAVHPADDAMAYLSAYLPVDQAAHAWTTIEHAASTLRAVPGETRTLAQLRADALCAILDGSLELPDQPPEQGAGAPGVGAPRRRTEGARRRWAVVNVTVSAATLAGLDDAPGHVDRFGAVPATVVRKLAATDATWRRLLTDPATGVLTDYSTRAYAPGAVLGDGVRLRDRECTFPGCAQPAWTCELDHIDPHPGGRRSHDPTRDTATGQTTAANLHPLCKHHHEAKTRGLWQVRRDPGSGRTVWTAPTGHTFTTDPHQTTPAPPAPESGTGPPSCEEPPPPF